MEMHSMKSHTHHFLLVLAVFLIISGLLACLIPSAIHVHKLDEEGSAMEESLKDLKLTSSAPAETDTDTILTPDDTPDETPAPDMQPATVSQDTVVPTDTGFSPLETPVKSGIHYPGYRKDSSILIPVDDPSAYNDWLTESLMTPTPSPVPTATPAPTSTPVPTPITGKTGADLAACRKRNKDFIAWIQIPGTGIDYPIVATNDTDYYLNHSFDGKTSSLGTLFSLGKSNWKSPSKNTAIYGHNISSSKRMFSELHKYKQESFYKAHPLIYLDSWYRPGVYRIFAAFDITVGDWDPSTASFASKSEFLSFVDRAKSLTPYDTGVTVGPNDSIISLITCDKEFKRKVGRYIVMAVRQ